MPRPRVRALWFAANNPRLLLRNSGGILRLTPTTSSCHSNTDRTCTALHCTNSVQEPNMLTYCALAVLVTNLYFLYFLYFICGCLFLCNWYCVHVRLMLVRIKINQNQSINQFGASRCTGRENIALVDHEIREVQIYQNQTCYTSAFRQMKSTVFL